MDAKELRIGNLFFDEDKTPCYYAGSWQRNDGWIHRDSANNTYKEAGMYPIELTEDIIEKCGFKKDDFITREFNKKGDYNFRAINHYENGFLIICNFMQGGIMTKHLHQLQNLFYCLTGKELEITL